MPNIKVTNSSSQSVPQVNDFPIAFHQDPDKAIPGEMRWEKSRLRGLKLNFSSCLSKEHLKNTDTSPQKTFLLLYVFHILYFLSLEVQLEAFLCFIFLMLMYSSAF